MNPETAKTIQQILDSLSGTAKEAFEQAAAYNATEAMASLVTTVALVLIGLIVFGLCARAIVRDTDLLEGPIGGLAVASGVVALLGFIVLAATGSQNYATIKQPRGATIQKMLGR